MWGGELGFGLGGCEGNGAGIFQSWGLAIIHAGALGVHDTIMYLNEWNHRVYFG